MTDLQKAWMQAYCAALHGMLACGDYSTHEYIREAARQEAAIAVRLMLEAGL